MLAPITVVKLQVTPWELRVFGSNGFLSFRFPQAPHWFNGSELLLTASVREFYVDVVPLPWSFGGMVTVFSRLPALETLVFAKAATAMSISQNDSLLQLQLNSGSIEGIRRCGGEKEGFGSGLAVSGDDRLQP